MQMLVHLMLFQMSLRLCSFFISILFSIFCSEVVISTILSSRLFIDSYISPGGGNGNSLQYSCLENPMDREAWQAIDSGVAKSQT